MDISSVSDWEYINVVGQYIQLETGDKKEIDPRLLARGFSEEQIQMMMDQRKSQKLTREAIALNLHFEKLGNWEHPQFDYIVTLYNQYDKNGVLPFPGSHSDQPAKIIDLFGVLGGLRSESETRHYEKQKRETEKRSKVNGKR